MKKLVIVLLLVLIAIMISLVIFMPSDLLTKFGDRARLRALRTQAVIDSNANGLIEMEEAKNAKARILRFDANHDGVLSRSELGGVGTYKDSLRNSKVFSVIDANGDSAFSLDELNNAQFVISSLDLNKDGIIDRSEYHK